MKRQLKKSSVALIWTIVAILLLGALLTSTYIGTSSQNQKVQNETTVDSNYVTQAELELLRAQLKAPGTHLFSAYMMGTTNGRQTATYVSNSSVQFIVCTAHFFKTIKPSGPYWITRFDYPDERIYIEEVWRMPPEHGDEVDIVVCYPGKETVITNFWTGTVNRRYERPTVMQLTDEERSDSALVLLTRNQPIQLIGMIDNKVSRPFYVSATKIRDGESGSGAMSRGGKLYVLSGNILEADPYTYEILGIPKSDLALFLQF